MLLRMFPCVLALCAVSGWPNHASAQAEPPPAQAPAPSFSLTTPCDPQVEAKRTDTWSERDQRDRKKWSEMREAAAKLGATPDPKALDVLLVEAERTDRVLQAELDDLVARCGWPSAAAFGARTSQSAFFIVQHAPLDYQLRYLPAITAAANVGDLEKSHWALLFDRVQMRQGKPQRYGTQMTMHSDEMLPWPIEDEAHVDERRAEVGMKPATLCEYVNWMGAKYSRCE